MDLVRLLAARGADLDARDEAGFTPLITAARCGEEEATIRDVVEILCSAGSDMNARTPGGGWGPAGDAGLSAPWQAAQSGHVTVVEALLGHGADVNAEAKGRTALRVAREHGHPDVAALLLERGARE